MVLLVIGLFAFVAVHLIPCFTTLRTALVERLGDNKYRSVFSIVSAVGLVMIVWGFSTAQFHSVYQPFPWGRSLALGLVPIALILFVASKMPTHIRALLRHPMLIGLLLWALAHLCANGDLRSILLFGSLGAYSAFALVSQFFRVQESSDERSPQLKMDAVAIVVGTVVAGLLAKFHGTIFGMPIM